MIKTAKFKLLKDNKVEIEQDIKLIDNNNNYSFKLDDYKMIINDRSFERENADYKLKIDIQEQTCLLHLKEKNLQYDIGVEKIEYNKDNNRIELIYKIETDELENKIIIEQGE